MKPAVGHKLEISFGYMKQEVGNKRKEGRREGQESGRRGGRRGKQSGGGTQEREEGREGGIEDQIAHITIKALKKKPTEKKK